MEKKKLNKVKEITKTANNKERQRPEVFEIKSFYKVHKMFAGGGGGGGGWGGGE